MQSMRSRPERSWRWYAAGLRTAYAPALFPQSSCASLRTFVRKRKPEGSPSPDHSGQSLQAKLRSAEAEIVRLQMTAQGHAVELNHVDEVRGMKSRMAELSAEVESLQMAKAEAGESFHTYLAKLIPTSCLVWTGETTLHSGTLHAMLSRRGDHLS